MRNVHGNAHVREVKAVAQPDERQSNDMVRHEFFEVFSWLLQHEEQHNHLLCPVTCLEQVVCLEQAFVLSIRERLVHWCRAKIPQRRAVHHIESEGAKDGKV